MLAQNLDENNSEKLSDFKLADLLQYLKENSGRNIGQQTFETITVSNTVITDPNHNPEIASVNCPDDTKVTGGGFSHNSNPINLVESKPTNNGWQVAIEYPTAPIGEITVYGHKCGGIVNSP